LSLRNVSTPDLEQLRVLVASGSIECPLTLVTLRAHGLTARSDDLFAALPFQTRDAMLAALDLALDERACAERVILELVWSGPQTTAPQTRDTAIVLAELFERARRRIMVAGYVFTHGTSILRPLHQALTRGASARMFLDIPGEASSVDGIPDFAARAVRDFVGRNWPFGPPYPAFFYDPRTATPGLNALLHAKCAVVDGRYALVTSANFTNAAQTRHVEVGVLIDDEAFALRLEGHFNALVAQQTFVEARFGNE
jgi:phosphatidylserine/phosphatidylglycerophosphate/cardiolipin synthase-like enzyme